MKADPRSLAVLGYANGFTLWHYSAVDITLSEITSLDYFKVDDIPQKLRGGDIIHISYRLPTQRVWRAASLCVAEVQNGNVCVEEFHSLTS